MQAFLFPETFIHLQESDYLRLVYHLYDSEGSDSEDEAEQRKNREKLAALKAKLRQAEQKHLVNLALVG